ncbi:MAG TPA: tRNA pseudouridine(38-40) synthase TruA [Vicinamibacterales bacterium]|nr:tRNA pseudouridine(38-40) synthase TruA [Vicinamibacterales bacterium]
MASRTLKIVVAYDGTRFVGWQRQAEGVSIQGLLEDALGRIEGGPVAVVGSGRTDAGVHALGQVASTRLTHGIDAPDLLRALNAILPSDVRVSSVEQVPDGFHARYSAREKTYRYLLICGPSGPFDARFAWRLPCSLDPVPMDAAARLLEGEHDFAAFRSAGTEVRTTRRRLTRSRVTEGRPEEMLGLALRPSFPAPGPRLLVYEVTGDGFLRHMVRSIVGSLVEVGAGRRDPAWLQQVLGAGARGDAGPTAPACGLFLIGVGY